MRFIFPNLFRFLSFLTLLAVVYTMVIRPANLALAFFDQSDYELIDWDGQEDTNEEEKQEKEVKYENIDLQFVVNHVHYFAYIEGYSSYFKYGNVPDFSLKIPIPPPERA